MKRITTFILLAMLTSIGVQAKHITSGEALQMAFHKTAVKELRTKSIQRYQLAYTADNLYAYNDKNGGFVILAADDCVSDIVLGYSDNGEFDIDAIPDGLKELLQQLNAEVAMMAEMQDAHQGRVRDSHDKGDNDDDDDLEPIEPLVKSQWNQSSPYNLMAPTNKQGSHYASGCVPTAMAQIMYYNRWPEHGTGSNSYSFSMDGKETTLSMDFSESTYDWENMCDTYGRNNTDVQNNAVAKLMIDCGISVYAEYTSSNTNANSDYVVPALIDFFSYDKSIGYVQRNYYTKTEWRDLIYGSLAAGHPIFYRGMSNEGGHAFVCDGYKDGLFHINWGWAGLSDGYFQIELLNPAEQGIGGTKSGYQLNQKAVINAQAECGGGVNRFMYCTGDFKTNTKHIAKTAKAYFMGNFENETCVDTRLSLGVQMEDAEGNIQYVASSNLKNKDMKRAGFLMNMTIPFADADLSVGKYIIRPAYYDYEKDEWSEMHVLKSTSLQYVIATVEENDSIRFSAPTANAAIYADTIAPRTRMIAGYDTDVDFKVSCTGGEYMGNAYLAFLKPDSKDVVTKSSKNVITLSEGESFSYTSSISNPTEAGNYDLVLINEDGDIISGRMAVTVEEAPTTELALTGKLTAKSRAIDDLQFNLNLTCTGGVFNNQITIYIYDSSDNLELSIPGTDRTFIMEGDEPVNVLFSSSSELTPGKKYFAHAYYANPSWTEICSMMFKAAEASGIEEIPSPNTQHPSTIYNLSGQRVTKPSKGIYVKDGKKILKL